MNLNVVRAIFKRNFVAYFSNPTGYVFICVFVLLVAFFAFWPYEFFNANLANLDQLNKYIPIIMLFFIPAITMSIWAEERRQGTDELLLTIPAADFDVVLGKYLAAVAIFSVALLFSALANWLVFVWFLGTPDVGLYLGTYFGYWLVGLAMLAIGMVASFLTGNLTVGFVLGAIFNAPLVFLSAADTVHIPSWATIGFKTGWSFEPKHWSLAENFRDFGQGVISLSGLMYFALIIVVSMYLSMALIGRRHWMGGKDGQSMFWHYLARAASLVVAAIGVDLLFTNINALSRSRLDISVAQLTSVSPKTMELLKKIDDKRPVAIDAYISPEVPESYAQTRLNLVNMLRELQTRSGGKVRVNIHSTEANSDNAANAETQFGIRGQQVQSRSHGAYKQDEIYLGAAFTCGLEKVVVPFIDRGVPVEYELIRSITTVSQKTRKSLGVLSTDARLMGGFDQMTMGMSPNQLIIDELQKQYDVKEVRADQPITEKFDVLLAVQPSSLAPEQMTHFLNCVKGGQPTAIFEDPMPVRFPGVVGTAAPKQPPGGMNPFQQRQPPQPKGDITPLWNMLGVTFASQEVIWQSYNPYPKNEMWEAEFIFVGAGAGGEQPFNPRDPISAGLREMLFLFPGYIRPREATTMQIEKLVMTGPKTGVVRTDEVMLPAFFGRGGGPNPERHLSYRPTREEYIMACHIKGKIKDDLSMLAEQEEGSGDPKSAKPGDAKTEAKPGEKEINVVLVSDIDVLDSVFFVLRSRGEEEGSELNFNFDNVIFVLNALDMLSDDSSFVDIRRRRPAHATLTVFEKSLALLKAKDLDSRDEVNKKFKKLIDDEQKKLDEEIEKIRKDEALDARTRSQQVEIALQAGNKRVTAAKERFERERDQERKTLERDYSREVRSKQKVVQYAAVLLPPILPLLMGTAVFFNRRAREREGVAKSRLR